MSDFPSLQQYLDGWAFGEPSRLPVTETIQRISLAAAAISGSLRRGALSANLGAVVGSNAGGDEQKSMDLLANRILLDALGDSPVAVVASEENENLVQLRAGEPLAVAIDPIDGSSNLDANISVGTIFAIWPAVPRPGFTDAAAMPGKGIAQLAAGFALYGPQTALVLTVGQGVQIFTLDPESSEFILTRSNVRIPAATREYAINASNYRHWDRPIREYIDDCLDTEGHPGANFNMRWTASPVAEAFRVLSRGGIFLYPRDTRPGYEDGRLRLVYEANPLALLIEQAGGAATDGIQRILEIATSSLHQRVPLVFGSAEEVARVARYYSDLYLGHDVSPLFGRRGLFQRQGLE
jgi:fructose-1,6-bisphosphatase I